MRVGGSADALRVHMDVYEWKKKERKKKKKTTLTYGITKDVRAEARACG